MKLIDRSGLYLSRARFLPPSDANDWLLPVCPAADLGYMHYCPLPEAPNKTR
jgi:hypothetical protein